MGSPTSEPSKLSSIRRTTFWSNTAPRCPTNNGLSLRPLSSPNRPPSPSRASSKPASTLVIHPLLTYLLLHRLGQKDGQCRRPVPRARAAWRERVMESCYQTSNTHGTSGTSFEGSHLVGQRSSCELAGFTLSECANCVCRCFRNGLRRMRKCCVRRWKLLVGSSTT